MPGKMVECRFCSNLMRSDNLKNHIKNVHRNELIVPIDDSTTKASSTVPLSKMQVINSILGTGMPSNSVPVVKQKDYLDKVLPVNPVLMKSMKGPGIKKNVSFPKKVKQPSTNDKVNNPKNKDIANTSSNNDDKEEAEILKVIENLDELYKSNLKKLVKNYLISDVLNDELMLPEILEITKELPDLGKLELEYLLNQIDQNRLDG